MSQRTAPDTAIANPEDSWPTIEEAAVLLKTSVRTLWRRSANGELEMSKRPHPNRKPLNICNPADLERLKPQPYVMRAEDTTRPVTNRTTPQPGGIDTNAVLVRLVELLTAGREDPTGPKLLKMSEGETVVTVPPVPIVPVDRKLWLTLEEASAYSGFARAKLKLGIEAGKLKARKDGPAGAIIIQRLSLERFSGV